MTFGECNALGLLWVKPEYLKVVDAKSKVTVMYVTRGQSHRYRYVSLKARESGYVRLWVLSSLAYYTKKYVILYLRSF